MTKQALITRLEAVLEQAEIKYVKLSDSELQYLEHNDTEHAKAVFEQIKRMTESLVKLETSEMEAAAEEYPELAADNLAEIRAEKDLLGLFVNLLDHNSEFLAQRAEQTLEHLEELFAAERQHANV